MNYRKMDFSTVSGEESSIRDAQNLVFLVEDLVLDSSGLVTTKVE